MKNHHEVGHFKNRLMIGLLSLIAVCMMAGQSYAVMTCSSCHGMPPLDSSERVPSTGAFKGSHQSHVSPSAVASDCVVCHSAAAGYDMKHSATSGNVIGLSEDISGGTYSKGAFFNQTSMPTMGTCSNVSCHSDPYSTATVTSPAWGDAAGCAACHSGANVITASGPATGSHTNVTEHAVACTTCHAAGTAADTKPSIGHADGNIDVANVGYATLNKTKGTAGTTCSSASCHANVYGSGSATTPAWGSTGNGCASCHTTAIAATGPATGSHVAHNTADCSKCHEGATTNTAKPTLNHADGDIDVNSGYVANVAKHTTASGYSGRTCSTATCHANVYGTGSVTSPAWGVAAGCEACHTTPIAATGPATGSHAVHNSTNCANCHTGATDNTTTPTQNHADGDIDVNSGYAANVAKHTTASGYSGRTCSTATCHANVYGTGSVTSPAWGVAAGCEACHTTPIAATGPATGSHAVHNSTNCANCHTGSTNNTTTPTQNHADGDIDVNSGYAANVAKHTTASGYSGRTCSTASCHANVYGTGTVTSPAWGVAAGCEACHTTPIAATGPATGSHAVHATADCSECHTGATNNTTTPTQNHADGDIDVNSGYAANVAKHTTASGYSGRTCSTASCHANVYGSGTVTTPAWGATAGCEACHTIAIGANGPATGSHTKHAGIACTSCHAAGTTDATAPSAGNGHIDGNVDVFYFNYPVDVPKHSSSSYTGTCSTAYCHSNGKGDYASPTWGGTSTGCNFCHPTLTGKHSVHTSIASAVYGSTADNSISTAYNFGCGNCHPTAGANHYNGTIDITLNSGHGGVLKSKNNVANDTAGYTQNIGVSVTCAAAYCHSNGMATPTFYGANADWYEASYSGDKCARCHGNSPNSGGKTGSAAHSAHVIGIHVDDIYNGVSKKLPIGGGATVNAAHGKNHRSTTINCNICHALTVSEFGNDNNSACAGCHDDAYAPLKGSAAIADKSKHVNGAVDVSFINQKIATKAQLAKSAFTGYTAANSGGWTRNSNSMTFKTYTSSYDVSKDTLFVSASWSQADGCANVACHNGKTVKWTDTVTCTSCHTRLR